MRKLRKSRKQTLPKQARLNAAADPEGEAALAEKTSLGEETSLAEATTAIEILISMIDDRNWSEVERFLLAEKGFRSEQFRTGLGALHYVAGRQFMTNKEACVWYLEIVVKRKYNVNGQSLWNETKPLHCACEWGNYHGVLQLIYLGANVDVEDKHGRTPYSYACASSIDAVEKMIVLERNGAKLSPLDIFWAATNEFASFDEADDVFHHLLHKRREKCSIDTTKETDKETPLHNAAWSGSIFGVKWLVERGALVNESNRLGQTPLMLACGRGLLKMRYLSERGADCRATDKKGQTALFYASREEHSEDDVKDAVKHLITERRVDVNSKNRVTAFSHFWPISRFLFQKGRTPLLHACALCPPSFVAIQQLIELGADISARDFINRNALHLAASQVSPSKSVIDYLIEKGVDVTCEDEYGKTPHQLAEDGEIRMRLRQHYDAARFSILQREKVQPDSIKICVIGSDMAGKTTFVNSLLQLNRPPVDAKDRTAGIEIHHVKIPGVGKGTTWDFGAQWTFHSAHGLFFRRSNTMFALVLRFRDGEEMTSESLLLQEGRYWCAFAKASLRMLPPHLRSLIRLVMIFNLVGVQEKAGTEASFQLKRVAGILQEEFGDTFEISHVIEMDCSKSNSVRMNNCRDKLRSLREQILETAEDVPKLCYSIEQNLSLPDEKRKGPLGYFMTTEEFEKFVAEDVGITLTDGEKKIAVEYLDSSGIIVNLGRRICVRPIWLCHNVIGPLLSPPYFPFGMPTEKSGKASKEDINSALVAFGNHLKEKGIPSPFSVPVDDAIEILLYLELCFRVEHLPEVYQIPALLQCSIPGDAWGKHSTMDVYRGQRYECVHCVDIISPSSFVLLQCRCSRLANTSHEVWKDGVKLVKIVDDKEVECLIRLGLKKERHCIDVILRWSDKAGYESTAKEFLDELKTMIVAACDERSPGVAFNWFYIDSCHLKLLDEDPAIYSSSAVHQKANDKALDHFLFSARPERRHRSRVRDLVLFAWPTTASGIFPADEDLASAEFLTACAAVDGSKWEAVSIFLGTSLNDRHDIGEFTRDNFVRMFKVLELWTKQSASPTVGGLLRWFQQVGIARSAIKSKRAARFSTGKGKPRGPWMDILARRQP
ncbi:death-associated protein kinase 1-like isoform X2 [Oscarella lobularis]|uniref:death-associated protein kinase 1-like isoform X2 n=1 Tax=Oscarella lobularis TaxID=121494 RepID=UPI0033138844